MAKKFVVPEKYQAWIEARRRYHLTDVQVLMARELGLNPHKFGKIANEKQESWKKPLPEFIEEIYYKRFGRKQPDVIQSIEDIVQNQQKKRVERKARQVEPAGEPAGNNSNNPS